jgi:hypothetical protein
MGGSCSENGEMRKAYNILVVKSESMRPLGRPKHRWTDKIKTVLRKIGLWRGGMCGFDTRSSE